jgi:hypothetical protein
VAGENPLIASLHARLPLRPLISTICHLAPDCLIARQNKTPSARRSPAHPFFAARSIPGSSNGLSLTSSPAWRKKRQAAVPVQAAQQDHVGFSQFSGKPFQRKGQLLVEYFSVCIVDYRRIWKIILPTAAMLLKTFPRPKQGERSSR